MDDIVICIIYFVLCGIKNTDQDYSIPDLVPNMSECLSDLSTESDNIFYFLK